MTKKYKIETNCVQAGYTPGNGEPRVLPIIQSTTYSYDSAQQMGDLFDLKESGYFYTRLANPTNDAVADKITALEGGVAGILTSSGQAATTFALLAILSAGDHLICTNALYGGSQNLISTTLAKLGIESTFVDPDISADDLDSLFQENTKAVFAESLSNPTLMVLDIEKFAEVAHKNHCPLIVDNTFPTPIYCRPFEYGADIVTHSTTKYMNGSATAVGGAIIDSGNFDWSKYPEKFPDFNTPDESYHGLVYTEAFGQAAYITKILSQLMRDIGAIPAPQNSFLLNLGLETLHLRMERHNENALAVAKHLQDHPQVEWIRYPNLEGDSEYELAEKYLSGKSSGVITLGIKGGRDKALDFINSLDLIEIVTHVADARTCVLHPASTTHRQLSDEELKAGGIGPELIRLSVGIENVEDIIEDLDQALNQL